jgi:hypothetical protein
MIHAPLRKATAAVIDVHPAFQHEHKDSWTNSDRRDLIIRQVCLTATYASLASTHDSAKQVSFHCILEAINCLLTGAFFDYRYTEVSEIFFSRFVDVPARLPATAQAYFHGRRGELREARTGVGIQDVAAKKFSNVLLSTVVIMVRHEVWGKRLRIRVCLGRQLVYVHGLERSCEELLL